ncbi:MAG: hypothetical protein ABIR33_07250 [Pyrinomonadaceae bacterium]
MRNLAEFECGICDREFYGDLSSGQALYTPILLDKQSGSTIHDGQAEWFSDWLKESFAKRISEPLGFEVKRFFALKDKVVLLNCLDTLYGHSLLKLLNAQYYIDHRPDTSLIVIVPPFLTWMLPEGIAEAWIVDLPLSRGIEWNDWLAHKIESLLEPVPEVYLSVAFSHPHGDCFDIERFSRVKPFALGQFERKDLPVVTFIWRGDRLWETPDHSDGRLGHLIRRLSVSETAGDQTQRIIRFAECLLGEYPDLDFAILGIGEAGGFPEWISDLRLTNLKADTERAWCERYARSQIVVGVHGSNMLLPSAHAGSVIELISADRWGNYLQDILFQRSDPREFLFRYRFVPHSTPPEELSSIASTMLRFSRFRRLMSPEFSKHKEKYDLETFVLTARDNKIN